MDLANLAIKRPTFVTSIVLCMLAVGYLSYKKLGIDLFPNITFPVVTVNILYPGAGPAEIETLVSRVLEEELSTVPGVKTLRSISREGVSVVVAEFTLETDVKYAEQQIKDRVSAAKRKLPDDVKEPIIRRIDPSDQPIVTMTVKADLPPAKLFQVADQFVKQKLEQVNQVGLVEVIGGRKREIHVELDQKKLKQYELAATTVSSRLAASGQNVPVGKFDKQGTQKVFRTLGEFRSLRDIEQTIVNFLGNDVPVTVSQVGRVFDSLVDETARTYVNSDPSVSVMIFKQSGANTISVADGVRNMVTKLNESLKSMEGKPSLTIVRDGSKMIRANVEDVQESILIGIALTIIVVFLFLGSVRSTIITGLALPNSLLGAFILMAAFGFTINVMSLLALSLAVGLLVDDAIVVRENIFRHIELGKSPIDAALIGTKEVSLAVIATTLAVISVFGPIGFLQGVVGQFFKEFGLTICFAMVISLFDALTIAPMLSAYLAGAPHGDKTKGVWANSIGLLPRGFDWLQSKFEDIYEVVLKFCMRFPFLILIGAVAIFVGSLMLLKSVPKTFLSPQDMGEFVVGLDLSPGTSLDKMDEVARKVDAEIHTNKEIELSMLTVGDRDGQTNVAEIFVRLVDSKKRTTNTSDFKEHIRQQMKAYSYANPVVKDVDMVAGGIRPFNVNIVGSDMAELEKVSMAAFEKLKTHPALKDVDISHRPGKPEVQVIVDRHKAERLGVSSNMVGFELRNLIEGSTPAVFRENGEEYDIRVRAQDAQRNLEDIFTTSYVPNINMTLLRLPDVADLKATEGPANINRQDRGRYIQISADIAPNGAGMSAAINDIKKMFDEDQPLPKGMRYQFVGQAENFQELVSSMITAVLLSVIFIYLVLASLYESFVTPFTIMLVLPLAACGMFAGLFLFHKSLDMNSMIGGVLLLGIASKNSILLVDYANQKVGEGVDRTKAMLMAGRTRLRPILMTTVALIAGMLPIAIGLNEASRQRTSMGVAVIGGLISSTFLTLLVVPACYAYIDRFRVWSNGLMKRIFVPKSPL